LLVGLVGAVWAGRGRIVISTYLDRQEVVSLARLILRGHEGLIVELAAA
jgi:hypothetical protein